MKKVFAVLEEHIPSILMLFTSLLIFVQVILRYFFGKSIVWGEELARYGIVWFVFLGSSLAVKEGAHASVDVIVKLLPKMTRRVVEILAIVISIFYCAVVVYAGMNLVLRVRSMGNITPTLEIPMFIPYLAIPVGVTLMGIRYVMDLIKKIQEPVEE
ncbi:MAG TPA: TRAP transporter small permease [Sphaerochaeta sp.]|nr:TRAP transporter small permease [Sphaerochaeta sp.]